MPTYGHPDDTPSQVPYGQALVDEFGTVVTSGNSTTRGSFASSGYHSLVVTVNNAGVGTCTVTVTWDFRDSVGQSFSTRVGSVPGASARRFLWPNQGDRIIGITYAASGGDVTLDLYAAGSNLAPFRTAGDWALAYTEAALGDPTQTLASGAAGVLRLDHCKLAGTSLRFDNANDRIYPTEAGMYLGVCAVAWPQGGGAFYHESYVRANPGVGDGSITGPWNPGHEAVPAIGFFDDFEPNVIVLDSVSAATYFDGAIRQTSGINQVLASFRHLFVQKIGEATELTI